MNSLLKLLPFLFYSSFFFGQTSHQSHKEKHDLTVRITGIQNQDGVIEIALYRDQEHFAKVGQTYRIARVKPEGGVLVHEFKDLPEDSYAVCLYHDENGNKSCDRNFFGIPTEAYAFSNNIRPKLSVPSFQECSMKLDRNRIFTIKLVY
jgi:uncharacterized protein (DUF2141 family)